MAKPFFLALDAGGTATTYVLADEHTVLGRVQGGTIKRMRTSAEDATAQLQLALRQLSDSTGLDMATVSATCVGTAGNTVPLVTDFLRAEIGSRVGGSLLVLGDVEIALDAAFPGESGLLVLSGTGSNVAARDGSGTVMTAGGYGPILSDQGSGHRIGSQALRAAFLAQDEGRENTLMGAILRHWKLECPDEIVAYAHACPGSEISTLSRVVHEAALAGDALSMEVLREQGVELAHLAILLHRRLQRIDGAAWKPRVAFAGSIMQYVAPVRLAVEESMRKEMPQLEVVPGVVDPVMGALWRGRHAVLAGQVLE